MPLFCVVSCVVLVTKVPENQRASFSCEFSDMILQSFSFLMAVGVISAASLTPVKLRNTNNPYVTKYKGLHLVIEAKLIGRKNIFY